MNDEPSTQDHDTPDSPEGMLLGGVWVSKHPDRVRRASLLSCISTASRLPPILILHGDNDRLVPFGQSVRLCARLREYGQRVEMCQEKGADHSGNAFWTSN